METDLRKHVVTTVYRVHFIFLRPDVSQEQPSRLDTMDACVLRGSCVAEVLLCPHRLRCCSSAAPVCLYCLHGVCLMIINKCDDVIFLYPLWKSEKGGGRKVGSESRMNGKKTVPQLLWEFSSCLWHILQILKLYWIVVRCGKECLQVIFRSIFLLEISAFPQIRLHR